MISASAMALALRLAVDLLRLAARPRARARGREGFERLAGGESPAASVVSRLFGTWAAARAAASGEGVEAPQAASSERVALIGHTGDLYAQSAEIARKMRRSAEVHELA